MPIQQPFLFKIIRGISHGRMIVDKRQKFGFGVAVSSIGIFIAHIAFNTYGVGIAFFLGVLSDIILFWAIRSDLKGRNLFLPFILPFLYSLSFGLFSFLTPALLRTRIILTILYAVGLYSVFLSENIFTVASLKTIALLQSARIVSLIISLITYFFLLSTILSLHGGFFLVIIPVVIFTGILSLHAVWTYTLSENYTKNILWVAGITLSCFELVVLMWFWPTTPVVTALFITSIWYVFTGLTHVWFDKRLFRNVVWEYVWVIVIACLMLLALTKWR